MRRSLTFYKEALGLKEVGSGDMSQYGGGRGAWVLLRDPLTGQQLELNCYPKGSRYDAPYSAGEGLDHIGFVVNDLPKKYKELLSKGASPRNNSGRYRRVAGVRDRPRWELDRNRQVRVRLGFMDED